MKFIRVNKEGNIKNGIVFKEKLYFLEDIYKKEIELIEFIKIFDLNELFNQIKKIEAYSLSDYTILSPIEEPRRNVICLGKNYLDHVNECATGGIDKDLGRPREPIFFTKMINRFVNPYENIDLNEEVTKSLDYEGELAVIIGKEGKNIREEDVKDYIFGYTILNDSSARDLQQKHSQWFKGKSLDNTCSLGPMILLKDETSYPPKLDIKTYVNNELRQSSNTGNFIFSIDYAISQLSQGTTLKVGDIIATGTPKGVGMGFTPPKFLKKDDILKIEVEKIGALINKIN